VSVDRTKVSFAEAEGKSEYPDFLKWGEVDQRIRSLLSNAISDNLYNFTAPYSSIEAIANFEAIISDYLKSCKYELSSYVSNFFVNQTALDYTENLTAKGDYVEIFNFLQFMLRHYFCNHLISVGVCEALDKPFSPYRIDLNTKTIIPVLDETQAKTLKSDLDTVFQSPFLSARDHLLKAIAGMNQGDHAATVREAITAVESAAREFSGESKMDLSGALKKLGKEPGAHNALFEAFKILYGYTSNEQGIRHSMLFGEKPNVDMEEAIFFVSACAAFIGYLSRKKEKLAV
jgi:hypothetical protein